MIEKSILFVGGGRRIELAKRFKDRGYQIIAYEQEQQVPILELARVYTGKPFNDEHCVDDLKHIIKHHGISLVLPLMDAAVPVVAELGVPVSSRPLPAKTCYDKQAFESFMLDSDYKDHYPDFDGGYESYGNFVSKPRHGFGSRDVIKSFKGGKSLLLTPHHRVYQALIKGQEYSVDAYFNAHAEFVDCVIRSRDRVAGGEVLDSTVVLNDEIRELVKGIGELLPITGPCNMQFIVDDRGKPWIIEVNARFGGGWTFSMEAGLDVISLLENDYLGGANYYVPGNIKKLKLKRSYRDHYFTEKK